MTNNNFEKPDVENLKAQLAEREELIQAIGTGKVDALLVNGAIHLIKEGSHPYKIVIDNLGSGAILLADGSILYANSSLGHTLKTQEHEFSNRRIQEFIPIFERPAFEHLMLEAFENPASRELTFWASDGSKVAANITLSPLKIDGAPGVCLIIERSGEQRAFIGGESADGQSGSECFEMNQMRYRLLADSLPGIVWTAKADGHWDYHNRKWSELTNLTTEQTTGIGWLKGVHLDDRNRAMDAWKQALESGSLYEVELRLIRGFDDSTRWHLLRGVPLRTHTGEIVKWFGTATDIQDYRKAHLGNNKRRLADRLEPLTESLQVVLDELRFVRGSQEAQEHIEKAAHIITKLSNR